MTMAPTRMKRADLRLHTEPESRCGQPAAPRHDRWVGLLDGLSPLLAALLVLLMLAAISPASAAADGPLTPTATDYLARITQVPPGIEATVVDGYLSLWLKVPADRKVVVLDFRGAPWVRFNRAGVQVNKNSQEYYLSQVPVPETPPGGLTRTTRPHWVSVSSGHSYMWREGRMHALAAVALTPGESYVGRWSITLDINGRRAQLVGGLWHTGAPSIVWFWPILVLLACTLAAWRVRSADLDRRLGQILTLTLLGLIAVATAARYLHGRPGIALGSVGFLIVILAAIAAAALGVLRRRAGLPLMLGTAIVALWTGLKMITVLTHGYVLLAIPAPLARCVVAALLGGSLGLALIGMRALDRDVA
jgi:hypothetical protein